MTLVPRPYQNEAKRNVYRAFKRGARSVLAVMPTGTGKTVMFSSVVKDCVEQGKRVAIFAHREELLDQAAEKIETLAGMPVHIEQGTRRQADDESQVVIACVFSMIRRLGRFPADRFDLVIIDEAHRTLAQTYRDLLDHFSGARVLGVTATPNRGDERALGQVYDEVAYVMTPVDAVLGGWLVPSRTLMIPLESLDLSTVRRRNGDFVAGDLGAVMSETKVLREAIVPSVELAGHLQGILFCCTIAHMHLVAETVREIAEERRLDLTVATVDGTTPKDERRRIMDGFRSGQIRWLINVDVATEGFDAPSTAAIIDLQPTQSRARYVQKKGRGSRPLPGVIDGIDAAAMMVRLDHLMATGAIREPLDPWIAAAVAGVHQGDDSAARRLAIALSAKRECLVLDFTDNSGRFDLADGMDALGGDYELPEREEAERILAAGDARHLLDALEQARAARAARLREAQARAGDPFALFDLPCRKDRFGREPTAKHSRVLKPMRLPLGEIDWRMANDITIEVARRERLDLSLYEQACVLARLGCPIDWLPTMTRAEASRLIEVVACGGWRRPADWAEVRSRAG